jgi:hypothetical protein
MNPLPTKSMARDMSGREYQCNILPLSPIHIKAKNMDGSTDLTVQNHAPQGNICALVELVLLHRIPCP